jgi:hypothetical protein
MEKFTQKNLPFSFSWSTSGLSFWVEPLPFQSQVPLRFSCGDLFSIPSIIPMGNVRFFGDELKTCSLKANGLLYDAEKPYFGSI